MLPPELWSIIIDAVLDESQHPYRYCTPSTFPQYQTRLNFADKIEEFWSSDDWKAIQLVCRTWNHLAGPRPHVYIRRFPLDVSGNKRFTGFQGISSIVVDREADKEAVIQHLSTETAIIHGLMTLVLDYRGMDIVLGSPQSFSNLRCLSVASILSRGPFWSIIQDHFAQLVSLTVRGFAGFEVGTYTLKNVEFLDVGIWRQMRLSCPSLRHLALLRGDPAAVAAFLEEHGYLLESLSMCHALAAQL
ncbi:hypothetical protein FRC17_003630, partial [Serendipita sp. 399]